MLCTEIFKLKTLLEEERTPFDFFDRRKELHSGNFEHYQICVPNYAEQIVSVIQGPYSYGGRQGLLEIRGLLTKEEKKSDSVAGWLKAEDVFKRIKKHFDKEWQKSKKRIMLSPKEAIASLKTNGENLVHCFVNPGGLLLGTDWELKEVEKLFSEAILEVGGEQSMKLGHGIVAFSGKYHFFEHDKEKMENILKREDSK